MVLGRKFPQHQERLIQRGRNSTLACWGFDLIMEVFGHASVMSVLSQDGVAVLHVGWLSVHALFVALLGLFISSEANGAAFCG